MHSRALVPVWLVAALLLPSSLLAQNKAKTLEAGLFVPYTFFGEDVEANGSTLGIRDDLGWGMRFGWNVTQRFETEVAFWRVDSEDDSNGDLDAKVWAWSVDFLCNWKKQPVRSSPYFAAGFGRMELQFDPAKEGVADPDADYGAQFLSVGLGYRYFFKPWLALRADGRTFFSNEKGSFLSSLTEVRSYDFNFQASVGVSMVFPQKGKFTPSSPPSAPQAKPK